MNLWFRLTVNLHTRRDRKEQLCAVKVKNRKYENQRLGRMVWTGKDLKDHPVLLPLVMGRDTFH